jgi:hypothetical protein
MRCVGVGIGYNEPMDITTIAVLSLFAAAAVGGIAGLLIGWLTHFECGLGAGLLLFGAVSLWFAGRCLTEYQAFVSAGPNGTWGEVVAVEAQPVGSNGSQPVPVVRFSTPEGSTVTVRGPRAGGYKVGDAVSVIYDAQNPAGTRIGELSQLRGCSIAMLLFGTFPFSFGIWFVGFARRFGKSRPDGNPHRRTQPMTTAPTAGDRRILATLFLALFASILWIGLGTSAPERRFVEGFAAAGSCLIGYALWGARRENPGIAWSAGVGILGINFCVWAFALNLLI